MNRMFSPFLPLVMLSMVLSEGRTCAQIVWEKHPANPVYPAFVPGEYPQFTYKYGPCVLLDTTGSNPFPYRMWFAGVATTKPGYFEIYYAVSENGFSWRLIGAAPVLTAGPPGSFDSRWAIDPYVTVVGDSLHMYYTGHDTQTWQLGLATSRDGITWVKHPSNPVLPVRAGTWESVAADAGKVFWRDSIFFMIYTGFDGTTYRIGTASSPDGVTWGRYGENPVFSEGAPGMWDSIGVHNKWVLHENGRWFLLYDAPHTGTMGIAHSEDAVTWTRYIFNPVFFPGAWDAWDWQVSSGSMLLEVDSLRFWYSGYGLGGSWQIGHASSRWMAEEVVSVQELEPGIPDAVALPPNYPNPFNPVTTVLFDVTAPVHLTLTIHNILGQEIARLADSRFRPGRHHVRWDASGKSSGLYICFLRAGEATVSRHMLLLR